MHSALNKLVRVTRQHNVVSAIIAGSGLVITVAAFDDGEPPGPILTVRHKTLCGDTWIDVHIDKETEKDLKYKHNNLDCMYSRGYKVCSF